MKIRKSCWPIILCVCLCVYLTLGAFVFIAIEQEGDWSQIKQSRREYYRALRNFSNANTDCGATMDETVALLGHVKVAWKQRNVFRTDVDPLKGIDPVWNLADSMAFSLSVVTTIGYGELVPTTKEGQLFCIVYGTMGIPLCYYMIVTVGESFKTVWLALFNSRTCMKYKIARLTLYFMVLLAAFWFLLFLLPALVLVQTEGQGWLVLKSFYFTFVSLSTIGFGDEMPHRSVPYSPFAHSVKLMFILYMLVGLSVMSITYAAVLTLIEEVKEKKRRRKQRDQRRDTAESHCDLGDEPSQACSNEFMSTKLRTTHDDAIQGPT